MGAVAFVVVMLILLVLGLLALVGGVIGLIRNKKRERKKTLLAGFLLGGGSLVCLVPLVFFGFIFCVNVLPPEDFTATEIVIEENGYQDTSFTADGRRYVALELEANYEVCAERMEPVFSYKTAGLLNGSQRGNYYAIPNEKNFTLIMGEYGELFCPEEEKEQILYSYRKEVPVWCWVEWKEEGYCTAAGTLDPAVGAELDAFLETSPAEEPLRLPLDAPEWTLRRQSGDGLILWEYLDLVQKDGRFYVVYQSEQDEEAKLVSGALLPVALNEVIP